MTALATDSASNGSFSSSSQENGFAGMTASPSVAADPAAAADILWSGQ